jgi:hypothetical protein
MPDGFFQAAISIQIFLRIHNKKVQAFVPVPFGKFCADIRHFLRQSQFSIIHPARLTPRAPA